METPYRAEVLHRLAQARPLSLLSLGPHGRDFYADYLDAHPECQFAQLPLDTALAQLPALGRFQFALIAPGLERLAKTDAGSLLARLRDIQADRFIVAVADPAVPATSPAWPAEEFSAYGLYRLAQCPPFTLYEFDISQYKQNPDWLNDRYWANPELYDKFRW
jgi:hypothetical protein